MIGADRNIGVYITYVLVPVMSCLYFEPLFVVRASIMSYFIMLISVYAVSADMFEVVYQNRPRTQMFLAYAAGFTIEYIVVTAFLFYMVKRAKELVAECGDAESALTDSEKERQMFNALCIKYTVAYTCDLMTDYMEPVKQETFSHCSQEKERMTDPHSYSEWIQHAYETFVIKDSAPDYLEVFDAQNLMRRLQTEGAVVYRHKTLPNGVGMEYFEATIVPLYQDENHFRVIIGYSPIDDIVNEEKQIQEQLKNEMTTLRNIHGALGSGGWKLQYNEQGEMISCRWSDMMRHMLGFESTEDFPDEFESWSERLHPDEKENTLQEYRSVVEDYTGHKTYDVEYRVRGKNGEYRWYRAAGRLSRREDGSPIAFDGVFIDTDEKHRTNEELPRALMETENARNELLLEHEVMSAVSRGYFSINSIDLVHDFYEEISSRDHFVHRPTGEGGKAQTKMYELCGSLVAKEYQDSVMNFFDLSTVSDRMQDTDTIEIEYLAADGNWHQARFIEKKRDSEGKVTDILYVTRIVSKEKQQEIERERLRIAYEVAEQANEAKTRFLLNMSHDIRTPMNAILGYSTLMRGRLEDPELQRYQERIERSGNLLLSIINNVLDMARIESGKMELDENYCKIGNIVNNIRSVFEMEAERKDLTIERIVDVEHVHIICDSTKIQEILTNIISNSVKYTPKGGKITVTTRELPDEREGYVRIQTVVEDTGIGMSKEFLPHLFDSFTRERDTTTAKVAGTGLGMAIVKSLVDLMGGTIDVESELGKGTRFTVTISRKIAAPEYYEKKVQPEMIDDIQFSGKRILLAEDNELNAEIAIAILKEMGFEVDHVEDGICCVDQYEKQPAGTYDFVLMDVQMSNMDGYKATKIIRRLPDKQKAQIPIIAMTANAFAEDRKKAFEMGMNGHIAKPIDALKIKETLVSILV